MKELLIILIYGLVCYVAGYKIGTMSTEKHVWVDASMGYPYTYQETQDHPERKNGPEVEEVSAKDPYRVPKFKKTP